MKARPHRSSPPRVAALALAVLSLSGTGCGIAVAILSSLAIAAISDAIKGGKKHHGDPTVLVVRNDVASIDTIIEVDLARVDGAEPATTHFVGVAPGLGASFTDVLDPGAHWVRVVFASGWRSRARAIDVVASNTVTITFLHSAPDLAALEGTWFGAVETLGVGHTYGLTIDAVGDATARTIDGTPDAATGTLEETAEGVYRVTWDDLSVLALVGDAVPLAAHAALVGDDGTVGVLEKGATAPLPSAVVGDSVGTWTGVQVRFSGATLDPVDLDAASATVSALQQWDGRDGRGVVTTGVTPLAVSNAAFLRFFAEVESDGSAFDLAMGLTADRASGVVARTPVAGGTFPDATTFQLLLKSP